MTCFFGGGKISRTRNSFTQDLTSKKRRKGYVFSNVGRVALIFQQTFLLEGDVKCQFSTHMNHVSVSPTDGNGPTEGQRKPFDQGGN